MKKNALLRKGIGFGIVFLFLGVSINTLSGSLIEIHTSIENKMPSNLFNLDGNILYVGGSGPSNYSNIQDAIDDANSGDTVFVFSYSSPYYENMVVNKSINLIGEDKDTTIIDSSGIGHGIVITANWVNISRFTINGSYTPDTYYSGIVINSNNNNISDNNISNNHRAIGLCSSYNMISGNIITNNVYGIGFASSSNYSYNFYGDICSISIYLLDCSSNIISGNNISSNEGGGIYLETYFGPSHNNTINGNTISFNSYGGIKIQSSQDTIITNNIVSNNWYGILLSNSRDNAVSFNTISSNYYEGIKLDGSHGNTILSNCFLHDGIFCYESYQNSILYNTVNGKPLVYFEGESHKNVVNAGQIILIDCDNITVRNLDLSNTYVGIELWDTNNCIISDNNMSDNYYGMYLDRSSYNSLDNNTISSNYGMGILIGHLNSNNNTISENTISSNYYVGIGLYSSSNNIIKRNIITDTNICGLSLDYGFDAPSNNNIIYHNDFINNTQHAQDECTNIWNDSYPSGGNYWDDYMGVDSDGDGIGDTPYGISGGGNTDWYPLMAPYSGDDEPPIVEIVKPEAGFLYILNRKIMPFFMTLIIGKIDIIVNASDSKSGIGSIELYVDEELQLVWNEEPYTWTWDEKTPLRFRHTIRVTAYDNAHNHANDEIIVWKFL